MLSYTVLTVAYNLLFIAFTLMLFGVLTLVLKGREHMDPTLYKSGKLQLIPWIRRTLRGTASKRIYHTPSKWSSLLIRLGLKKAPTTLGSVVTREYSYWSPKGLPNNPILVEKQINTDTHATQYYLFDEGVNGENVGTLPEEAFLKMFEPSNCVVGKPFRATISALEHQKSKNFTTEEIDSFNKEINEYFTENLPISLTTESKEPIEIDSDFAKAPSKPKK